MLQAIGAAAAATALSPRIAAADGPKFARMPPEGKGTPRICLGGVAPDDEPNMRRVKQIGVDYVLTGGPRIPWDEADLRARIDRFKAGGLTLCNMMISGFDDVIWGRPGARRADRERHRVDSRRRQGRACRSSNTTSTRTG